MPTEAATPGVRVALKCAAPCVTGARETMWAATVLAPAPGTEPDPHAVGAPSRERAAPAVRVKWLVSLRRPRDTAAPSGRPGRAARPRAGRRRGVSPRGRLAANDGRSFGVRAYAHEADVSQEDQVVAMVDRMVEEFGTIDIMVANAGLQRDAAVTEMTVAQWQKVLDVNLTGQFLCAREAAKAFIRRGVVPEVSRSAGKTVCMSSVHQVIPWAGHVNYAASKGGVLMLMQTLAQELAPQRIRVNAVAPGAIRTPINRSAWDTPEAEADLLRLVPYGRVGDPEDIADAVTVLASDLMDYVVGTTLYVDGGMTLFPGFATGG
ncbi:SDR family oxidoreductase [Streptomyces sp. MS1.HAVA.3]|uniref:SDR family oxidoreductase n=1 Tax=Streptomyces caledonius TaxID=3134107 RepID=A0ABU8TZM6_9ACTN